MSREERRGCVPGVVQMKSPQQNKSWSLPARLCLSVPKSGLGGTFTQDRDFHSRVHPGIVDHVCETGLWAIPAW